MVQPSAYVEDLDAVTLATAPRRRRARPPAPRGRPRWPSRRFASMAPRRSPARHAGRSRPRRRAPATSRTASRRRLRGDRARSLPLLSVQVLRPRRASASRKTYVEETGLSSAGPRHARPRGVPGVLRPSGRRPGTPPIDAAALPSGAGAVPRPSSIACCRHIPPSERANRAGECCSGPRSPPDWASGPSASRRRNRRRWSRRELEVKLDGAYTLGPRGRQQIPAARHRRPHRPARRRHAAADRLQDRQGQQRPRACCR